ncbi:MAG: DUF2304 domain-containing protein [Caldilineales bacterium]|nr:DUF2304 domain-containing protein [Caldilineales bacterium]
MTPRARLILILAGIFVLLTIISLLRSRRLKEEYALVWVAVALAFIAAPIFSDQLDLIAYALGVEYPPALYFGLGFVGILLMIFQVSRTISRFSDQIRVLTQEVAILRHRLDQLEPPPDAAEHDPT